MSEQTWPPYTGRNFGLVDPDAPPPAVASCKEAAHPTDSFVITLDIGSQENYRCDLCRIVWREPLA